MSKFLLPFSQMLGAEWNILDASGVRVAICGINDDMSVDYGFGREVAEALTPKKVLAFKTETSFGWIDPSNFFYEALKKDATQWAELTIIEVPDEAKP